MPGLQVAQMTQLTRILITSMTPEGAAVPASHPPFDLVT